MQNRLFPEVFDAFFEEVRPATVIELGAARGGFTYFLSEMRARFGFRLSAYDIREHDELMAIVSAERIPFAPLDVLGAEAFERIAAEIRSDGVSVVCCDGGAKALEIGRFGGVLKSGDFILAHDYAPSREYFESEMRGRVWAWLEITDADVAEACAAYGLVPYEQDWFLRAAWLCLRRGTWSAPRLGVRARPAQPLPASPAECPSIDRPRARRAGTARRRARRSRRRCPVRSIGTQSSIWRTGNSCRRCSTARSETFARFRERSSPGSGIRIGRPRPARLALLHALEEILAALAARGIEPLALPGAGLDLVDQRRRPAVPQRLRSDARARPRSRRRWASSARSATRCARTKSLPERRCAPKRTLTLSRPPAVAIRLVLRWCLFDSAARPANGWLRATARRISIGAAPALILGPEAQLLHLARHIRGNDLHRLHAIAGLIAAHSERIDFPLLFSRASEWGVVEPLRCSLLAVDADWHAPLPPDARRELLALLV